MKITHSDTNKNGIATSGYGQQTLCGESNERQIMVSSEQSQQSSRTIESLQRNFSPAKTSFQAKHSKQSPLILTYQVVRAMITTRIARKGVDRSDQIQGQERKRTALAFFAQRAPFLARGAPGSRIFWFIDV